jgi:uncharacterized protein YaeQ
MLACLMKRLIRKACGRAKQVIVYCYGGNAANIWFEQNAKQLLRSKNLTIIQLSQQCYPSDCSTSRTYYAVAMQHSRWASVANEQSKQRYD